MCGIAGIISKSETEFPLLPVIAEMSRTLRHRGPDGEGFLAINKKNITPLSGSDTSVFRNFSIPYLPKASIDNHLQHVQSVFAHRRLAIIDLDETGHQPLCDSAKNIWITFNGEIYNYKELREELKAHGYSFISESDTEVVVNAYLHWGENCLQKFNGMWAFCIYNSINNSYFISRDRLGVKPLYYINNNTIFAFASEQKAFITSGLIKPETNEKSILSYLHHNELEFETANFFHGIQELWPGTSLNYCGNTHTLNISSYYHPKDIITSKNDHLSDKDLIELIKTQLLQTIDWRMRSDVEVGTCLSGGIDSSVIAGIMASKTQKPVSCFTAAFNSGATNELPYAKKVVEKIQGRHFITEPGFKEFEIDLDQLIYALDVPIWDTSTYAQFRVMKLAQDNKIKVVLDGQGADEHFAGYHHHFIAYWKQIIRENGISAGIKEMNAASQSIPRPVIFLLKELIKQSFPVLGKKQNGLMETNDNDVNFSYPSDKYANNLNQQLLSDFGSKRLKSFLRCEDRCGMWHSVESRTPFSDDYQLTQLLFSFNGKRKIKNGVSKYLLREAAKDFLPDEIYRRYNKVGFETPMTQWVQKMLPDILSTLRHSSLSIIKKKALNKKQFKEHELKILFKLYMLVKWQQMFSGKYKTHVQ